MQNGVIIDLLESLYLFAIGNNTLNAKLYLNFTETICKYKTQLS